MELKLNVNNYTNAYMPSGGKDGLIVSNVKYIKFFSNDAVIDYLLRCIIITQFHLRPSDYTILIEVNATIIEK